MVYQCVLQFIFDWFGVVVQVGEMDDLVVFVELDLQVDVGIW